MNPVECKALRLQLGAFVDGELAGVEMLRVSQHLESCSNCTQEVADLRAVGMLLRDAAAFEATTPAMCGLAGGVIARVRAESAQSWRGLFQHAIEDWHWAIVCGGSVTATFVTVFTSAVLLFGPLPVREDSLRSLITNLGSSAGTLLIEAAPAGDDKDSMLMQVDTGVASGADREMRVLTAMLGLPTERDLVDALTNVVVPKGRLLDLSSMPENDRRYTESLLDNISRFRLGEPGLGSPGPLTVHRVRLVTNTGVSAKMMESP